MSHISVMLTEVIDLLRVKPGKWYLDATLGAGGHTEAILKEGGYVVGLDQDPEAIALVKSRVSSPHLTCVLGNFSHLNEVVSPLNIGPFSGILFDLGTSQMQLESLDRGFSFNHNSPLDMRMSPDLNVTAADLVNALSKKELYALFTNYSQEHRARAIADHLVRARQIAPIKTTQQLASIVERVYGGRQGKLHPATKVFQALRMAVNDELNALETALPQAVSLLEPYGRLVALSFHEGEDRIVKQFIKSQSVQGNLNIITKKPLTPSPQELGKNPRSRSAKLRVAEKV